MKCDQCGQEMYLNNVTWPRDDVHVEEWLCDRCGIKRQEAIMAKVTGRVGEGVKSSNG